MTEIESPVNKYIDVYINNYVRQFRNFITSNYIVNIDGVAGFIATDDHDLSFLLRKLQTYGFEVTISNGQDTIDEIQVEYTIRGNANDEILVYIIRKTKCFDFWERNVLFPKTKRSFFRTPTPSTLPFSA